MHRSHGSGEFLASDFHRVGEHVVFEPGVLVFHAERIELGDNVYIGHRTILKGYHKGRMLVGDNSWVGQGCFFHSAGDITIGRDVGIGPFVKILTSYHREEGIEQPILESSLNFEPVVIGDGSDIGLGTIILPGVVIGRGVQIGAGAVVTRNIPDYSVALGSPARVTRTRV